MCLLGLTFKRRNLLFETFDYLLAIVLILLSGYTMDCKTLKKFQAMISDSTMLYNVYIKGLELC